MSHNANKVNTQEPNRAGVLALALTQLGGVTSFNNQQYLGVDASGDPAVSTAGAPSLDFVYSANITGAGWAGSTASMSVNARIEWRRNSAAEVVDSSYVSIDYAGFPGYTTWGNRITLAAGDYLCHLAFPLTGSSSNTCSLRLYNETDSAWVGGYMQLGEGRQANSLFTHLSLTGSKIFSYRCAAVTGSWSVPDATGHEGISIWVIKL
jgi:hypothetical protein